MPSSLSYIIVEQIKKLYQPRKHYNTNISESIKLDVGNYAEIYGTKTALDKFQKKYPKHTFLRISINNWKRKNIRADELQKKKDIANISLLDFGLFVLYENKSSVILVTQQETEAAIGGVL